MKRTFWITLVILIMCSTPIYAEEKSGFDVQLTTDKQIYSSEEEIKVTLTTLNNNENAVSLVALTGEVPEGYSLLQENSNVLEIDALQPNETAEINYTITKQVSPVASIISKTFNPFTGNDNNFTILFILLVFAMLAAAVLVGKSKKSRINKIMVLACIFTSSILILSSAQVKAADSSTLAKNIPISVNVTVDDQPLELTAIFSCYADKGTVDELCDDDNDSLSNYLEDMVGSDKSNPDTDGDGLTDYQEVIDLLTDPTKVDSDDNGIGDSQEDMDEDGIVNIEEYSLGLNPADSDTDKDELKDGDELILYLTDPLKEDTDGDGVTDGKEIELGTNPLIPESEFSETVSMADLELQPSVTVTGLEGDKVGTIEINPVASDSLVNSEMTGYIGQGYDFGVQGEISSAQISFDTAGLDLEEGCEPAIYYFNKDTQSLEYLENQQTNGTLVTAETTHFSTYVLLNKKKVDKVWEEIIANPDDTINKLVGCEVMFVLDRSKSMDWNDPKNYRQKLTTQFIDELREIDGVGVVTFTKIANSLSEALAFNNSDKEKLKNSVNAFTNDGGYGTYSGTNGYIGLRTALDTFSSTLNSKYVFFLTDGTDTENNVSYDSIISEARARSIKIYTVGLGDEAVTDTLKKIASETDGKYYFATDDTNLDSVYEDFGENVDKVKDSNNDGISDYYTRLMTDGKLLTGTGTKVFGNASYEEIQSSSDFDGDSLSNGKVLNEDGSIKNEGEIELKITGNHVYAYFKSSPILEDTDFDGINDANEAVQDRFDNSREYESHSYNVDYTQFLGTNTDYNSSISKLSVGGADVFLDRLCNQSKTTSILQRAHPAEG